MAKTTAPKISILVPVCNVEKYLAQCLDSIVSQTLQDMEIIVINDGSTDGSLEIIKKYAATDKRIRILDKVNEGYGRSMNRGINMATGEYIGIVESDDWIDPDMFENLVKIADENQVQVVKSDFYRYTTTGGEQSIKANETPVWICDRVITPRKECGVFWIQPSIWSAIYRRDFLNDNEIRFLESPGASYQDLGFSMKCWFMASRVYLTPRAWLHYRCDNENSSVKSAGKIFCVCDEWGEIDRYLAVRDKKLHAAAQKIIVLVKSGNYQWNMNRLTKTARRRFRVVFALEYDQYIRDGKFSPEFFDNRCWNRFMCKIHPLSPYWHVRRTLGHIVRPVYKTRIANGYKEYLLLGKCVKRTPVPEIEL